MFAFTHLSQSSPALFARLDASLINTLTWIHSQAYASAYLDMHYGQQLGECSKETVERASRWNLGAFSPLRRLQLNQYLTSGITALDTPNGFDTSEIPREQMELLDEAELHMFAVEEAGRLKRTRDLQRAAMSCAKENEALGDTAFAVMMEHSRCSRLAMLGNQSAALDCNAISAAVRRAAYHCHVQDFYDGNHRTALAVMFMDLASQGLWLPESRSEQVDIIFQSYLLLGSRGKATDWLAADADFLNPDSAINDVVKRLVELLSPKLSPSVSDADFARLENNLPSNMLSPDEEEGDQETEGDDSWDEETDEPDEATADTRRIQQTLQLIKFEVPHLRCAIDAFQLTQSRNRILQGASWNATVNGAEITDGIVDVHTISLIKTAFMPFVNFRRLHWQAGTIWLPVIGHAAACKQRLASS